MNNLARIRIKKMVSHLLSRASITEPPVALDKIVHLLKIKIKIAPYEGENDLSGVLIRDLNKTIIGVNSNHNRHRQRFTISHEIGHYLLHEGNQVYIDRKYKLNFRDETSSYGTNRQEVEANAFASMLLIPEEFLLQDLQQHEIDILDENDIQYLARRYNVSPQAMSLRLSRISSSF